LFRCFLTKS